MKRRGFTIVELIITITIMGILLTLAVVNVNATQLKARDDKRTASIEAIGSYLDNFYNNGAPSGTTMPSITNMVTNPSFETGTTNAVGANATITQTSAWSSQGTSSLSISPISTNTDSFAYYSGSGMYLNMVAGNTYTLSAVLRVPANLSGSLLAGRAGCIMVFWNTGSYSSVSNCGGTTAGTYPLSLTFTIPGNAVEAFVRLYHGGTSSTGPVYYDSVMLTQGTSRPDYADGNAEGWMWNGAPGSSTSTGPLVVFGVPGTYPSVALASSPSLTLYLPDADTKAFTAPGQSDPYATFIPATNAIQSAENVAPQPTIGQYVYQPIDSDGNLCVSRDCRKYNLYYRLESDNLVRMVTSKNQ